MPAIFYISCGQNEEYNIKYKMKKGDTNDKKRWKPCGCTHTHTHTHTHTSIFTNEKTLVAFLHPKIKIETSKVTHTK